MDQAHGPHVSVPTLRVRWIALTTLAVLLTACTIGKRPSSGVPAGAGPVPITIGVLAALTGQGAVDAAEMHLNVDLAIAQTNASGGIDGHQIRAVYADSRGDPILAVKLAGQLVQQDHAAVVVGGVLSAECLAIEQEAARIGVAYLTASGCPSVEVTSKYCNKNTFRMMPVGPQIVTPLAKYIVATYGAHWAIVYPDYAFGQAQLQLYASALSAAGAAAPLEIAIPLGEQDPAPYAARIPTDGSIDGIINAENGADLTAVDSALRSSGAAGRLPVIFSGGKEQFGGAYPDDVDGFVFASVHLSTPAAGANDDRNYATAFAEQVLKQPQLAEILGGPTRAVAGGSGYQTFVAMSALRQAMLAAHFTGRADTPKLIAALEDFRSAAGPAFPAGDVEMNKIDHQGAATVAIARVAGQSEELLQSVPPGELPPLGSCRVP